MTVGGATSTGRPLQTEALAGQGGPDLPKLTPAAR
jgi:hypothetical protein